jgi:gliding motility-associated-like protein
MRSIYFFIFFCVLFTGFKVVAQCSVLATPSTATINCGQSVQLNASATGGTITYSNDFNSGTAGSGWNTNSGAQFNNPCTINPNGGAAYLWMGASSAAPRIIETQYFNINCAGSICFDLALAIQGGASPCEGPDLATEGVYLQYSTNFGATWTTIFYFDPNINGTGGSVASPYTSWANYCYPIPAAAISPNTSFRWAQLAISGNLNDHWGIDNVVISGTCANPHYYVWTPPTSLSATNIANPIASPTSTTTYTVYYTDGISDSCSSNVTINVIAPDVDAGPTQSICLGDTVTLNGSSNTTVVNQVTFSNSSIYNITDYSSVSSTINATGLNMPSITSTSIAQVCLDITHTFDGDLTISLLCPGGVQLILSQSNGGGGDNYTQTCFTPTATNIIGSVGNNAPPFTGTFAPEGAGGFNALNGCLANGTWTLIVADNVGGDIGTLNNWSITFNNNVSPVVSWNPTAGMTGSNTYTPTIVPTTSGTYTISLTTSPGCTATDVVQVFVNPLPTPTAGSDKTICAGSNTNLVASGGSTFSWSPSTGLSSTTVFNPVASPTVTTSYIVTVSNGTCAGKDTVVVNVNPLPVVDAGANTTICFGNTVNLQSTGASNYFWSPTTGLSSTNISNPVSSPTATITYYVAGIDANGCANGDSVKITVNPTPVATAGNDVSICVGSNTILSGSGSGNYSWTPGTGLNSTTLASPTATPTVTTSYVLTVTNGFNCTDKDTVVVTVNPLPPVDAGTNQIICNGSSIQLNATGALNYSWSPAATLSNGTISNPVATPTANTTYIVTGTDANGCVKTDAVSIILIAAPTITAGGGATYCIGGSTQLTSSGGLTYSWSPATNLSNPSISNPISTATITTTYTVTGSSSNGCTNTNTVTVTVNPLPVISTNSLALCPGASDTLIATGAASYVWTPNGISAGSGGIIVSPPLGTTNYTVTGTDANGCISTATTSVNVGSNLASSVTTTNIPCFNGNNGSATISNNGGTPNYTYVWSSVGSGPSANNLPPNSYTVTITDINGCQDTVQFTISQPTQLTASLTSTSIDCNTPTASITSSVSGGTPTYTYAWSPSGSGTNPSGLTGGTYTLTLTDANNCAITQTITIASNTVAPNASAGLDQILNCGINPSVNLNGSSSSSGVTYSWAGPNSFTSSQQNPSIGNVGSYTLTVTDPSNGCTSTDVVDVTQSFISASFVATPTAGVSPLQVIFNNTSSNATSYTWSFGNGNGSSQLNDTITYGPGIYQVVLIAQNSFGCIDTAFATIIVEDPFTILIPNIFTPNNDGTNDVFFIPSSGLRSLNVGIYDRWGKLIHEITSTTGTWTGGDSPDGTYYYILTAKANDGKDINQQGYFQLIR